MALYLVEITHKIYVLAPDEEAAEELAARTPDLGIHDCCPEVEASRAYAVHPSDLGVVPLGASAPIARLLADNQIRASTITD